MERRFTDGEKILCYNGPFPYEAECLRSQIRNNQIKYFVHYTGWMNDCNEWVPEYRMLKYNETNLQKQKELAKPRRRGTKSLRIAAKAAAITTPPAVIKKIQKQKPEKKIPPLAPITFDPPSEQAEPKKIETKIAPCFAEKGPVKKGLVISIPPSLQTLLVDDWNLVNHQKKILQLPARITVDHVITCFLGEKVFVTGMSLSIEDEIVQIMNDIRKFFNVSLEKLILFQFERLQYIEILNDYEDEGLSMCQIYGAAHLLRLFSHLDSIMSPLIVPETGLPPVLTHTKDLIRYVSANSLSFFSVNDYVDTTPGYQKIALG